MTEAISNLRQIGLALFEFEQEYGCLPDSATIGKVKAARPGTTIPMGASSSNDYFRQLIVTEIAQNESFFYARTSTGRKPDNVFLGARALAKGECAFAYIAGLSSSENPSNAPIVVFPLVPGKRLFDYKLCRKYYYGKAIICRLDNSVTSLPVDKSGHVYIGGKDLFDPSQPFWNGRVPDVKWPE